MPSKRQTRIATIQAIAREQGWALVDPPALARIRVAFPEIGEDTLRHDLRETGLPLHPSVEGVRMDDLASLARTLLALERCYQALAERSPEAADIRKAVLAARRKAEWVIRNPKVDTAVRTAMEEKLLWLRVWLENPPLFSAWLALRQVTLRNQTGQAEHPFS
ncbi:MAG: hypothetical protein KIT83_09730 [Bryobacterales bacterium]|nr:hypothetical protein [Bryobacterales bacterium]